MPASGKERFCGSADASACRNSGPPPGDQKQFPAGHDIEARISLRGPASKYHLQGHLDNARRSRAGDAAEIAVDHARIGIIQ